MDEPSAGVDLELKEELYNLLKELHFKKRKTIILVSNYIEKIQKLFGWQVSDAIQ
ncbi:unnamed protein product [marine sediment metagenome]|uniref:Uncharacterized protein n=1 Tax=marine sediment metagenome TaxID=412755 RepID=X0VFT0_9ZZZZ